MARTNPSSATIPDDDDVALFGYDVMRRKLGGISQSLAEQLVAAGPDGGGIDSITIGVPGSRRPRRMFTDAHIADYIARREQQRSPS